MVKSLMQLIAMLVKRKCFTLKANFRLGLLFLGLVFTKICYSTADSSAESLATFDGLHRNALSDQETARICTDLFEKPAVPITMKAILGYFSSIVGGRDADQTPKNIKFHRKIIDGVIIDAVKRCNANNSNAPWLIKRLVALLLLDPQIPAQSWVYQCTATTSQSLPAVFCKAATIFPKVQLDYVELDILLIESGSLFHRCNYENPFLMLDALEEALYRSYDLSPPNLLPQPKHKEAFDGSHKGFFDRKDPIVAIATKICTDLFEKPAVPVTMEAILGYLSKQIAGRDTVKNIKDIARHQKIIDGVILDAVKRLNEDKENAQWLTARLVSFLLRDLHIPSTYSWLYRVNSKATLTKPEAYSYLIGADDTPGMLTPITNGDTRTNHAIEYLAKMFGAAAAIFPVVLFDNHSVLITQIETNYGFFWVFEEIAMLRVFEHSLALTRQITA